MGLKHVVVTSVDRDDIDDRGAGHFAATIRALKAKVPDCSVEVLTPDFLGVEEQALATVIGARPDVFNHNIETVRRLHRRMRGAKASYDGALELLRRAKQIAPYPVLTKSGIIVGPRGDERRGGGDDGRPARPRRRRRHDRPVPAAIEQATPRSTAGCIRTSSPGSVSRARHSVSARSSPAPSCARATAPTSRSTPQTVVAPSHTELRRSIGPPSERRPISDSRRASSARTPCRPGRRSPPWCTCRSCRTS